MVLCIYCRIQKGIIDLPFKHIGHTLGICPECGHVRNLYEVDETSSEHHTQIETNTSAPVFGQIIHKKTRKKHA